MTLLSCPEAAEMSTEYARETKKQFGRDVRSFGEFASGDYVKRTEALKEQGTIPEDATILYLGFYIDSKLVGQMGKDSVKPLSVILLNFKREHQTNPDCRRVRGVESYFMCDYGCLTFLTLLNLGSNICLSGCCIFPRNDSGQGAPTERHIHRLPSSSLPRRLAEGFGAAGRSPGRRRVLA